MKIPSMSLFEPWRLVDDGYSIYVPSEGTTYVVGEELAKKLADCHNNTVALALQSGDDRVNSLRKEVKEYAKGQKAPKRNQVKKEA